MHEGGTVSRATRTACYSIAGAAMLEDVWGEQRGFFLGRVSTEPESSSH